MIVRAAAVAVMLFATSAAGAQPMPSYEWINPNDWPNNYPYPGGEEEREWPDGPNKNYLKSTTARQREASRALAQSKVALVLRWRDTVATKFKVEQGDGPYPEDRWYAWISDRWVLVPTLGTRKGVNSYRDALDKASIKIGDDADEILGRPAFPYARGKIEHDLVLLSVSELAVKTEYALLSDVYSRARKLGLDLCPAEVGPQLRLAHRCPQFGVNRKTFARSEPYRL
jgi:hypothetical protein